VSRGALACACAFACAALARCAYPVTAAACAVDADCPGGVCIGGLCHAGTRDCPTLEPRFSDINANLFQVGCGVSGGTTSSTNCHGAVLTPGGSNLDLSSDHAYAHLVGIRACNSASKLDAGTAADLSLCLDGGVGRVERRDDCGVPAAPGDLTRVLPSNPQSSFLLIKLGMTSTVGPCGSGMPPDHPGMYSCPSTLATIAQWIAQGAQDN
jgi:hypothetical protein